MTLAREGLDTSATEGATDLLGSGQPGALSSLFGGELDPINFESNFEVNFDSNFEFGGDLGLGSSSFGGNASFASSSSYSYDALETLNDIQGPGAGIDAVDELTAQPQGGVYSLRDIETNAVVRTGRSSNLAARRIGHSNDPVLGNYRFQTEYSTDLYSEQRGLEQVLYDRYPGAQFGNGGFNKIRAISLRNLRLPVYMQAARIFLGAGF